VALEYDLLLSKKSDQESFSQKIKSSLSVVDFNFSFLEYL
jgi:hypothetical protein